MIFDWMSDPAAWAGLATLIALEIVLGIDNIVFIAVLVEKLPAHQRDRARVIGMGLALCMRLILLASVAWLVTLQSDLFTISGHGFSGRDLILILGGVFLLFKGTTELHERLEGHSEKKATSVVQAALWQVLLQIVVLDAVFSLDSVITAVGMVSDLSIMAIAVIVAMAVMLLMSKALVTFVLRHPTVVILCLGFLMMIGFTLIVEGFGYHLPKGYLYAAIGFSVGIEALNQVARKNRDRYVTSGDLRERTAAAVLRLLGGQRSEVDLGAGDAIADQAAEQALFAPEEKEMIEGVLALAERPVTSIMTPRAEVDWIDLTLSPAALREQILAQSHSRLLLGRGSLDEFAGVARARDLMRDLLAEGAVNIERSVRQPLVVHDSLDVLRLMDHLRKCPVQLAMIVDEFGSFEGIVTPTDVLEAIAGDFPHEDERALTAEQAADGSWLMDGWIDIRHASRLLDRDLSDEAERYATLAGYLLWQLGRLPAPGDQVTLGDLEFEVLSMEGRTIDRLRVRDTRARVV